jgi:hypothetical protein
LDDYVGAYEYSTDSCNATSDDDDVCPDGYSDGVCWSLGIHGDSCTADSDCNFRNCRTTDTNAPCSSDDYSCQCVSPLKPCPSTDPVLNCSGNGRCMYVDRFGVDIDDQSACRVDGTTLCYAVCSCYNYDDDAREQFYGDKCADTLVEYVHKTELRAVLIEFLRTLAFNYQDPEIESINQQAVIIERLTANPYQVPTSPAMQVVGTHLW